MSTPPPKQPREQDSSDKFSTSSALLAASVAPLAPAPVVPASVAPAAAETPAMTGDMKQQPSPTATAGKAEAEATPKVGRGGKPVKSPRNPMSAKTGQETWAVFRTTAWFEFLFGF